MFICFVSINAEVMKKRVHCWKEGLLERQRAGGRQGGGGAWTGGVARGGLRSGWWRGRGK